MFQRNSPSQKIENTFSLRVNSIYIYNSNQIVDDANLKLLADAQLLELRLLFNPICQT